MASKWNSQLVKAKSGKGVALTCFTLCDAHRSYEPHAQ